MGVEGFYTTGRSIVKPAVVKTAVEGTHTSVGMWPIREQTGETMES